MKQSVCVGAIALIRRTLEVWFLVYINWSSTARLSRCHLDRPALVAAAWEEFLCIEYWLTTKCKYRFVQGTFSIFKILCSSLSLRLSVWPLTFLQLRILPAFRICRCLSSHSIQCLVPEFSGKFLRQCHSIREA